MTRSWSKNKSRLQGAESIFFEEKIFVFIRKLNFYMLSECNIILQKIFSTKEFLTFWTPYIYVESL